MAHYKAASFLALGEGSQPVRIFGDLEDPIVMAPGIQPSGIVRMRVPRHEFTKLATRTGVSGTLELWFTSDGRSEQAADVSLADWVLLPRVDEIHSGFERDEDGELDPTQPRVYEQRWYLADKRYSFVLRPPVVTGLANGPGSSEEPEVGGQPVWSAAEAATRLLAAMGIDELVHVDTSIAEVPAPANIDWRMSDAPGEWIKFEQHSRHILVLRADGRYSLYGKGSGEPTGLPEAKWELHGDSHEVDSDAPPYVIFTSAPNRIQVERTFTLAQFEYVGLEADGRIVRIDELSYTTDEYYDWGEAIRDGFAEYPPASRHLALQSIGRFFKFWDDWRETYLPLLAERAGTVGDRSLAVRVMHSGAHLFDPIKGAAANASGLREVFGVQFDPRIGLVILPRPAWKLSEEIATVPEWYTKCMRLLHSDELQITATYEYKTGGSVDFFMLGYTRGSGGAIAQLGNPAGYLASDQALVVRMPNWHPYERRNEIINAHEMRTEAEAMAGALLSAGPDGIRTRRFKGFHAVNCSGAISEVRWNFDKLTTEVKVQAFHLPASGLAQAAKRAQGRAGSPGSSNQRQLLDQAARESRNGSGVAAPAVRAGFGLPFAGLGGPVPDTWKLGVVLDGQELAPPQATTYPEEEGLPVGYWFDEVDRLTLQSFSGSATRDDEGNYVLTETVPYADGPNTAWHKLTPGAFFDFVTVDEEHRCMRPPGVPGVGANGDLLATVEGVAEWETPALPG